MLDAAAAERLARFAVDSPDRADARAWAVLSHGARILVPAGIELGAPIVVEFLEGGEGAFAAPRLFLELGRNARAHLWARFGSDDAGSDLGCAVTGGIGAELAEGARLDCTLLQSFADSTPAYLRLDAALGANAELAWREFHLGSSRIRARSSVRLEGEGARADLEGAWVLAEGQVADLGTVQRHLAPGTASDALYKGVVAPGGRSAFRGLIEVAKDASKTDAYLANRNLLLGPGARADSLPALAIGTNDVRCTHGSTTGRVDPAQVHYLETRGIPSAEARR
ncbi:MAG TPA: SufD family Fe-S cluster assembly protein, partial [Spirochaetales bacterium]|nr:SufD family Fe-S cluster assembly protein [Spirochaetales bacterium]